MDEKPKTYHTKQRQYKRRIDVIMSIIFVIGLNVLCAFTSYYYEGADFWDSLKQFSYGTLVVFTLTLLTIPLIFACLAIGRYIKRKQENKKEK